LPDNIAINLVSKQIDFKRNTRALEHYMSHLLNSIAIRYRSRNFEIIFSVKNKSLSRTRTERKSYFKGATRVAKRAKAAF